MNLTDILVKNISLLIPLLIISIFISPVLRADFSSVSKSGEITGEIGSSDKLGGSIKSTPFGRIETGNLSAYVSHDNYSKYRLKLEKLEALKCKKTGPDYAGISRLVLTLGAVGLGAYGIYSSHDIAKRQQYLKEDYLMAAMQKRHGNFQVDRNFFGSGSGGAYSTIPALAMLGLYGFGGLGGMNAGFSLNGGIGAGVIGMGGGLGIGASAGLNYGYGMNSGIYSGGINSYVPSISSYGGLSSGQCYYCRPIGNNMGYNPGYTGVNPVPNYGNYNNGYNNNYNNNYNPYYNSMPTNTGRKF